MAYRSDFSDGFPIDEIGVITGSSTYRQLPNRPGQLFRLKAQASNIGSYLIGTNTGTFFGMGVGAQIAFEIDGGDDTGWFKLMGDNLNSLYCYDPSGSAERLTYWIQR